MTQERTRRVFKITLVFLAVGLVLSLYNAVFKHYRDAIDIITIVSLVFGGLIVLKSLYNDGARRLTESGARKIDALALVLIVVALGFALYSFIFKNDRSVLDIVLVLSLVFASFVFLKRFRRSD